MDEMKIKEGMECTGKIVGFTELGNINDDLLRLGEHPDVAKYVLVILVRGTLCNLEFPMLISEQELTNYSLPSMKLYIV